MTPADWQARLAPWIGSAVQVVTTDGETSHGTLIEALEDRLTIHEAPEHGGNWYISYFDIRAVWVQLTLEEEEPCA